MGSSIHVQPKRSGNLVVQPHFRWQLAGATTASRTHGHVAQPGLPGLGTLRHGCRRRHSFRRLGPGGAAWPETGQRQQQDRLHGHQKTSCYPWTLEVATAESCHSAQPTQHHVVWMDSDATPCRCFQPVQQCITGPNQSGSPLLQHEQARKKRRWRAWEAAAEAALPTVTAPVIHRYPNIREGEQKFMRAAACRRSCRMWTPAAMRVTHLSGAAACGGGSGRHSPAAAARRWGSRQAPGARQPLGQQGSTAQAACQAVSLLAASQGSHRQWGALANAVDLVGRTIWLSTSLWAAPGAKPAAAAQLFSWLGGCCRLQACLALLPLCSSPMSTSQRRAAGMTGRSE